jgi:uncharacterized protein YjbI with pentapeptide repeats
MATKLWKFLKTDIREFFSAETAKTGTESGKAVLELAKALKEQGSKDANLAPYVQQISSLLDILNSPLAQIVGSTLPFVNIATSLLKLYTDLTKEEPSLEKSVALISQAAYLESFKTILGLPENQELLQRIGNTIASNNVEQQIRKLADLELDEREAKRAITCFHTSKLSQAFGDVLTARLQQAGLTEVEAKRLSDRVAWDTHRYMNQALAEAGDSVKPLAELYRNGGREILEKYQSLDTYLEECIKPKPLETVFAESFTFQDLYVPLNAQPIGKDGMPDQNQPPVGLEQWARDLLNDDGRKDRVMFIQGGPGRGKSVFCRMFADWVRQQEYPRWIPILIRLWEIRSLEKDFEETLRKAVDRDFAKNDPGWLTDRNTRFLFLLDGFDELLMEGRTSGGLEEFLRQVGRFQESCASNSEKGHRMLITGRTLALQSIERLMPHNLERVEISPMDRNLQRCWFAKWEELAGKDKTDAFQQFLQDKDCPESIQGTSEEPGLAQEPLSLYLLAAMHRDGELAIALFRGAQAAKAKILIYERTLDWVLTKQRPEWLQREITELEKENLQRILTEAGLCVMQAGGEFAPIEMIEQRLKSHNGSNLIDQARQRLGDNSLRNALAAFYLQPGKNQDGSVEFAHKSFGEFLCAKRIKESLEDWTYTGRRGDFVFSSEQMNWEIYDLLGAPVLTPEVMGYLSTLIMESQDLQLRTLFKRLHQFYLLWCKGGFMDADSPSLPQRKMQSLRKQLGNRNIRLGQRQIDVFAGLNVMVLLLELHYCAQVRDDLKNQISFHPCGQPGTEIFDEMQLRRIISYSDCVQMGTFSGVCGLHLRSADLSNAYLLSAFLRPVDLNSANLSNANLISAFLMSANLSNANLISAFLMFTDLRSANLANANLTNANLTNANLTNANLTNANLTNATLVNACVDDAKLRSVNFTDAELVAANLTNADLESANLTNADLRSANLTNANLKSSNLEGIKWDKSTQWSKTRWFEAARNVPETLKLQLNQLN